MQAAIGDRLHIRGNCVGHPDKCGEIVEAEPEVIESLSEQLRDELGFEVDAAHLAVFGRCRNCTAMQREQMPQATQ